jgi:hypothetical protein
MTVYSITHNQRVDDYVVVQLLTEPALEVGEYVTVSGLSHGINGTHMITALPAYLFIGVNNEGDLLYNSGVPIPNQVLFYDAGSDLTRAAVLPYGTLYDDPTCNWIDGNDVEDWLGIGVATAADEAFIEQCATAANQFCFRRREEAGYLDSPTVAPNEAVKLGTTQYAGALYRSRGSIGDSFASFDQMGTASYTGLSAIVKQLLGIDRPACA